MFKHILVPIDGSELSGETMVDACRFARESGARLTFFYAKPVYFNSAIAGDALFDDSATYAAFRTEMNAQAEKILAAASVTAVEAGVDCDVLSSESDSPYQGIIAAAEDKRCDLIFMASHGRHGASALLLGSETQKVLTHCRIPVLVYR